MRKFLILLTGLCLLGCSSDPVQRNPYLQDISFRVDLDRNLPLYNGLKVIGSPVYVGLAGAGTRGVYVMQTSIDFYQAFEASCPNHAPNGCSTLQADGVELVCSCEGYRYNLFTGQQVNRPADGSVYYDLFRYNAQLSGNTVIVSN